ncbi:MAG: hypothetical protein IJD21_07245 [Oscillospiraceae bacterium]|nr:hypothetical protein [Oscillospiraceae bacterium]
MTRPYAAKRQELYYLDDPQSRPDVIHFPICQAKADPLEKHRRKRRQKREYGAANLLPDLAAALSMIGLSCAFWLQMVLL